MSKCKECKSRMILMSGVGHLEADAEPYEAGIEEEAEITEIEIILSMHFCVKCSKAVSITQE